MAEGQRVSRSKARPDRAAGNGGERAGATSARSGPAPDWAASHLGSAFPIAGVQRKVEIGPAGDAYEREADRVSADVASGRTIAPSAISPIGTLPIPVGQRAPDDKKDDRKDAKKKDEKPKAPPAVQKAEKPDDKKPTEKKPPEKKPPEAKKEKETPKAPAALQKADKAADTPAAAKPEDKKKDDKRDEKPKAPPAVQKAGKPDDKKPPEKKAPEAKKPETKKPDAKERERETPKAPAAVQKAARPDEKKPEEKKPEEKKTEKKPDDKRPSAPVQRAAPSAPAATTTPKGKDKKEEQGKTLDEKLATAPVQRSAGSTPTPSMEQAASRAIQSKGAGEPINAPTRNALESRMGVDLGGVRVHQDRTAAETAEAINARAFTHGNDIWLGRGQSQSDTSLMAHEATHVVQQAGGVHRMLVQRNGPPPPAAADAGGGDWDYEGPKGKIKKDGDQKKMLIPSMKIPDFKLPFTPAPLTLPKKAVEPEAAAQPDAGAATATGGRSDKQREIWDKMVRDSKDIDDKIAAKLKGASAEPYALQLPGEEFFLIGDMKTIKERTLRPYWNKEGKTNAFQVDHKQEVQLTPEGTNADREDNFWLLDAKANMASGSNIKTEKESRIQDLLNDATVKPKKKGSKKEPEPPPDADKDKPGKSKPIFETPQDLTTVRQQYAITIQKFEKGLPPSGTPRTWTVDEIKKGVQIEKLQPLSAKDAKKIKGSKNELVIFTNESGGSRRTVKWPTDKPSLGYGKKALDVTKIDFDEESKTGKLTGMAYKNTNLLEQREITLDIRPVPGVDFGGYITPASVNSALKKALKVPGASPVELDNVELSDRGFTGRGRVLPDLPLLKGANIDLVLDGDNIYLSRTFSAGDLKFPGPVKVTAANLEIFAGTTIGVRGDVNFEIERVGRGRISGLGEAGKGIAIEGEFDFDSELFSPATVKVWYREQKFGAEGKIGVPEGKVKGIKSAMLTATIDGEKIDATGTVQPNIPGIEQGELKFSYDPTTGIVISGKLDLKKDIPGLEGGSVTATLAKPPGADKWKVKAAGEATPKIPGVSSKLSVTYDDGAFDAVVTAGYEKGMLKGSITVGATNRPVGDDGKPAGPPPDKGDKVTLYGGGSVTLKIAPWLQATAAIKLLPNGEIEVTGEIGLPAALEIFKEKKLDKNIFKIGIDIPIVGVSVLGQRIGIFANISGGLDLSAGIGPGELNQLKLAVTYNPAHEENTTVTGDANLHIPAHAGLRLFVRGSLGVGIPIVSASAGLEIGGSLGLEGALDAGVHVEWSPSKGLDLTAQASIYVEPKLKFDITGFVLVEADLLLTTVELYSKKWQLASFEYGSGLRFGLKFPIHYQEGQEFNVSLSDVEFEVPKIDPGELLGGLIKKIA